MRRKKRIFITNPKLNNLRNSLRKVVFLATLDDIDELREEEMKIIFWKDYSAFPPTIQDKAQAKYLNDKKDSLNRALNQSIILCPVCGKIDKNMTFNPASKKWYCNECYVKNQLFYVKKMNFQIFP